MADNIQRSQGRSKGYKFDRGGVPTEFGPFIGVVMNNIDPARMGRLQVYIEAFTGVSAESDPSLWRTVRYMPPFFGSTQQSGTNKGIGGYVGNPNSYGMWFTPPDIGTQVLCVFVNGDPNEGYYIGCVPEEGVTHMTPAIGASKKYKPDEQQLPYFAGVKQAPVTEINDDNPAASDNPRYFDSIKPVHSVITAQFIQQGLLKDVIRGPITSSSQRESPSSVFGISTPGRPIYQSGLNDEQVSQRLAAGQLKPTDTKVIGRRGGHSFVMDDGDINGYDNLVRIRTSKGHQITMSDDGDCFYITHANGQTWLEFGSEGTVDVFATNSVNVRTQGEINLHADKRINMFAGEGINMKSKEIRIEADSVMDLIGSSKLNLFSGTALSVNSDGTLALKSRAVGGWSSTGPLAFKGLTIDLNGLPPVPAAKATKLSTTKLPDTTFVPNAGWQVEENKIETICSRAPTHEPYPYHNRGVQLSVNLGGASGGTDEVSETDEIPPDYSITEIEI